LVRKFTDSIGEFQQTENAIQNKHRELLVRRFQIVKPELEEKEILESLEDGGAGAVNNVFAFAANTEDLERKLEHLRAQRRSMMRLEKSILALNKLFFDMQNLVLAQGDALKNIETYIQHTVDYQKANTIEQAIEYQKNIRKVKFLFQMSG
jgi:t-SNARE complex subunit (syntaxin)